MFKRLGIGGMTISVVGVVALVLIFGLEPGRETRRIEAAPSAPLNGQRLSPALAARGAGYRQQVAALERALAEHEAAYQAQVQELTARAVNGRAQLQQLIDREQAQQQHVRELQQALADLQPRNQQQFALIKAQYDSRFAQFTEQLSAVQAKLEELNQSVDQ